MLKKFKFIEWIKSIIISFKERREFLKKRDLEYMEAFQNHYISLNSAFDKNSKYKEETLKIVEFFLKLYKVGVISSGEKITFCEVRIPAFISQVIFLDKYIFLLELTEKNKVEGDLYKKIVALQTTLAVYAVQNLDIDVKLFLGID